MMVGMNYLAVVVAAVAAFVASTVWYIAFGKARAGLLGRGSVAIAETRNTTVEDDYRGRPEPRCCLCAGTLCGASSNC
jgi:hypothetical protein